VLRHSGDGDRSRCQRGNCLEISILPNLLFALHKLAALCAALYLALEMASCLDIVPFTGRPSSSSDEAALADCAAAAATAAPALAHRELRLEIGSVQVHAIADLSKQYSPNSINESR
jgi:hypothetical protein